MEELTLKQYCDQFSFSYSSNWVQKKLKAGELPPHVVSFRKVGTNYLLTIKHQDNGSDDK